MTRMKLQTTKTTTTTVYYVTLPKFAIEEIAHWPKGMFLEVEWIEKGKNTVINKPYFRISKPDNLWVKNPTPK